MWSTDSGESECTEMLSGSSLTPSSTIEPTSILDGDLNIIGIQIKYAGSPTGSYVLLKIYCDLANEFSWD